MTFVLPFPAIDPVLVEIGPFAIRWYALAYIGGLLIGWRYGRMLAGRAPAGLQPEHVDDFLIWATLGVVLGGRFGYVLFYNGSYYLENPLASLEIWRGGMSFHGGLLGVVIAGLLFCRRRRLPTLTFADVIFCAAPIGLFLGRIANFINAELPGRVSDVPWAMVFPGHGPDPRHPSQLYQATMEGLALFVILALLWRRDEIRRRPGILSGVFLVGYAVFRAIGELFRQPDAHIGFFVGGTTMGQWLSAPMLVVGVALILRAAGRPPVPMSSASKKA